MKIAEIIELENSRTDADKNTIFLINENRFWRAYGWSAWLCVRLIKPFEVMKKEIKTVGSTVCFVGFPMESLERHFDGKANRTAINDKDLRLDLRPDIAPADTTYEAMQTEYKAWFDALPLTKRKEETKEGAPDLPFTATSPHLTVMSVMREIMLFPADEHSPTECVQFIRDTKKKLGKIIF